MSHYLMYAGLLPMLLLACAACTPGARPAEAPVSGAAPPSTGGGEASGMVTILHTNDFHGRVRPIAVYPGNATAQTGDPGRSAQEFDREGTIGGFAHLATAIHRVRKVRGDGNVLLLHAGDTFSDDLLGHRTRGEAVIKLMNALGYQFMALGNHDFDYGSDRTRELQRLARFPMRGANVLEKATGAPFLGDPTTVFTIAGVRVGVLALGYHNTADTGNPDNVRDLEFTNGLDAARRHLPRLRERANIVVVLSHQGTAVDEMLAREVRGIDLIIGGHSHDRLPPQRRVNGVWIAQALSNTTMLGEMQVRVQNGRITEVNGSVHSLWTDAYAADPTVHALVERLRAPYRGELDERIATAAERIGRRYRSESPFDRLVGDILRAETGAEIALLPGVGYGVSLTPGPVTREALYTLLPHPSKVVMLQLTGTQVLEVLEQSATNQDPGSALERVGGLVQTSGLRWTVDLTRPVGSRVRDVFVGAEPIERQRSYAVVTHSGMLAGIHRYTTFQQAQGVRRMERQVVEVVEEAFRRTGVLRAPEAGRVTLIREP